MPDIDLNALAECEDDELNERPEVQEVTQEMILSWAISEHELPPYSAKPFSHWIHDTWNEFNEDGDSTVGDVLRGGLADWRGNVEPPKPA